MSILSQFTVDPNQAVSSTNFHTIQAAVDAATAGTTITVAAGDYAENVTIATSGLTLLSAGGRDSVSITGSAGTLGTIQLAAGVNDVTIGAAGQGFTITGFDGASPGIETAAVYLQGAHQNIVIRDNDIVANGDAGLQGEYSGTLTNITVDGNTFSGQTFTGNPAGSGFGTQFTLANVPRQLVVLGGDGTSSGVVFTDNEITGTAGGLNDLGQQQGNTLVTIDAANSTISGNDFTGFTNRYATQLRVREENTTITDNHFSNDNGGNLGTETSFANDETPGPISGNTVTYGDGDDLVIATAGNDTMDGGAGTDTLVMANAGSGGAFVSLASGVAFSTATGFDTILNVENVSGSSGDDALIGDAGDNVFYATAGNDTIDGGDGSDTFDASAIASATTVNLDTGAVSGGATASLTSIENASTGDGADIVTGSTGDNVIATGAGDDIIDVSSGGNNTVDGGDGLDQVIFAGNKADFSVAWDGTTATVTNTGSGDVTTVTDAGRLSFSDGDVLLVDDASGEFSTIQSAVDAAANGDTILVADGTYTEQVTVNGLDDLSIVATGEVTIEAPADVVQNGTSGSGRAINAVVSVIGSTNVTFDGFDIDGAGVGNTVSGSSANFIGVSYRNSTGGLTDVDVTGIRDAYPGDTTVDGFPVQSGNQRGVGVQVDNDSGTMPFFMHGGSISDFQKNATVFNHTDLDIDGVTITGGGAQTIIAQNGIQVGNSTGSIANNTVQSIGYAGASDVTATLMLLYGNTDLDVTGNTVTGSDHSGSAAGIYLYDFGTPNSGGSVTDNIISTVDYGIFVGGGMTPEGVQVAGNSVTDIDVGGLGVDFEPTALAVPVSVDGSEGADYLQGGDAIDTLSGLGGDDTLIGGGGADDLSGGAGDDSFLYGSSTEFASGETVDGGSDTDTVVFASTGGDTLVLSADVVNVEAVTVSSDGALDSEAMNIDASAVGNALEITGNGAANMLTGTVFADTINGGGGDDTLIGGGGDDNIDGGDGLDTVVFSGARGDYSVSWDGTTATVTATGSGEVVTVTDAGHLAFGDSDVYLVDDASAEFATIQSAVDQAVTGDEILVADGTYSGNVTIADKSIAIVGASDTGVMVNGQFTVTGDMAAADVMRFQNLQIDATGQTYGINVRTSSADIVGVNGGTVVLDGVEIANAREIGLFYANPSNGSSPTDPNTIGSFEITDSTFRDNGEFYSGARGQGHINLFGFNGNLTLAGDSFVGPVSDLGDSAFGSTPNGTVVNPHKAVSVSGLRTGISGVGGYVDAGTLSVSDVSVSGFYSSDVFSFYDIQSFASVAFADVDFAARGPWGLVNFDGVGGTVDLTGISGTNSAGMIGVLQGLAGDEVLTGTDGADVLLGRGGADALHGAGGDDTFVYNSAGEFGAGETVDGGAGTDTVLFQSASGDTLTLSSGVTGVEAVTASSAGGLDAVAMNIDASAVGNGLEITGNGAANTLTGTAQADTISGGGGDDTLIGGGGDDNIDGGDGTDTQVVADAATIGVDGGHWTVTSTTEGTDTLTNVEVVDADGAGGARTLLVGNGGFATIQEALDEASAGDTILIGAGTYDGNFTVNTADLTIKGVGDPADIVIQGSFVADNGITGTVTDFLETATGYNNTAGNGIAIAASGVTLENLTVDGFYTGVELGSVDGVTLQDVDIKESVNGIRKGTAATINDLTVNGGTIHDVQYGIIFAKANGPEGRLTGFTVDGTTFDDLGEKGIYTETGSDILITGITMHDVGQFGRGDAFGNIGETGAGIDINLKYASGEAYSNIVITDFDFTDVGLSNGAGTPHAGGGAITIKARDDGSLQRQPGHLHRCGGNLQRLDRRHLDRHPRRRARQDGRRPGDRRHQCVGDRRGGGRSRQRQRFAAERHPGRRR